MSALPIFAMPLVTPSSVPPFCSAANFNRCNSVVLMPVF
jgi:hypothetical protein